MTIKEKVAILQAMSDGSMALYDFCIAQGDKQKAKEHIIESIAYETAVFLLTDEEYALTMRNIWTKKKEC
jgi:hypothetical protein